MKYIEISEAEFISRPNRFLARVRLSGEEISVHVKNTGRCRELLLPHSRVYLSHGEATGRKTPYDLVAVEKERYGREPLLINMDSTAPNLAVGEWLAGGLFSENATVRAEVKYRNSRFDFYVEDGQRRAFVEVKGVTLENEGVVSFPDAPTERGVKHLTELRESLADGYEAYAIFVVQMKGATIFRPNDLTHRAFGDALRECAAAGVSVIAMDCIVTPFGMCIDKPVPIDLSSGEG